MDVEGAAAGVGDGCWEGGVGDAFGGLGGWVEEGFAVGVELAVGDGC